MTADLFQDSLYLISALPLVAFGVGFCLRSSFDDLPFLSKAGLAYGIGALALCVEGLFFSWIGLRWGILSLGVPLLVLSAAAALLGRRQPRPATVRAGPSGWTIACWIVAAASALSCALFVITSRAVSVDFLLFYGVKAERFALARGIDLALLREPFFYHGVPQYPPLMPIVEAWGAMMAGRLPWRVGGLVSWIWFLAALAPMAPVLRRRIASSGAAAITAFWAAAVSLSFMESGFGGNGDAPLVFYETSAGLLVLAECDWTGSGRWFTGALLAGAALTKQEGILAAPLLAAGVFLRDLLERRRGAFRGIVPLLVTPIAAAALWAGYRYAHGIPATVRLQTDLRSLSLSRLPAAVRECVGQMGAGTAGMSWIFPTLMLLLAGKRLLQVLPALAVSLGVLGALLATYIGKTPIDLHVLVFNTFSRAAQPALSLWIVAAGVAWFERTGSPNAGLFSRAAFPAGASRRTTRDVSKAPPPRSSSATPTANMLGGRNRHFPMRSSVLLESPRGRYGQEV
jgi:hypothetical protein